MSFAGNRRAFLVSTGTTAVACFARWPESRAFAALGEEAPPKVSFEKKPASLEIAVGGRPFGSYVFRDEKTFRPFFANVFAPSGRQATRNHPPRDGEDLTDHATMHPGIWLAFGDISGADFWRNKARVEHVEFIDEPKDEGGSATFKVRNKYVSGEKTICTEECRHTLHVRPYGYLLIYDSVFTGEMPFTFGDQEEMGLGVRIASSLRVEGGSGRILNAEGLEDEKKVWGKPSMWCDYSGVVDKHRVGMLVMPHPENFRKSWFHARDYGVLAANPFGRNAFTMGEKSQVVVKAGEEFRLRFGVLVHSEPEELNVDWKAAYADYLELEAPPKPKTKPKSTEAPSAKKSD